MGGRRSGKPFSKGKKSTPAPPPPAVAEKKTADGTPITATTAATAATAAEKLNLPPGAQLVGPTTMTPNGIVQGSTAPQTQLTSTSTVGTQPPGPPGSSLGGTPATPAPTPPPPPVPGAGTSTSVVGSQMTTGPQTTSFTSPRTVANNYGGGIPGIYGTQAPSTGTATSLPATGYPKMGGPGAGAAADPSTQINQTATTANTAPAAVAAGINPKAAAAVALRANQNTSTANNWAMPNMNGLRFGGY